jgi:hypothetical protein
MASVKRLLASVMRLGASIKRLPASQSPVRTAKNRFRTPQSRVRAPQIRVYPPPQPPRTVVLRQAQDDGPFGTDAAQFPSHEAQNDPPGWARGGRALRASPSLARAAASHRTRWDAKAWRKTKASTAATKSAHTCAHSQRVGPYFKACRRRALRASPALARAAASHRTPPAVVGVRVRRLAAGHNSDPRNPTLETRIPLPLRHN